MLYDFFKNVGQLTKKKSKPSSKREEDYNSLYVRQQFYTDPELKDGSEYIPEYLNYERVQEVCKDPQINVALDIVFSFLLTRDYTITPADDSKEQEEMVEFLEDMFDNLETPFKEVRKNLYLAIKYGLSVQEKVFKIEDNLVKYKAVYPIHIKTLQKKPFKFNKKGELTHIHQTTSYGEVDLKMDKVIMYSFNAEFDEIAGHSILETLYKPVRDKRNLMKWLLLFLHKHEQPILYGKVTNNAARTKVEEMLRGVVKDKKNFVLSSEDEVGIIESTHHGEAFFQMIQYYDNLFFRCLGIGNLLMSNETATGSYSQSKTQSEFTMGRFNGLHEDVALIVQREMIDPIIAWNWGVDVKTPKFSFSSFVEDDILLLIEKLEPYFRNMIIDNHQPWFKDLISACVEQIADIEVNFDDEFEDDLLERENHVGTLEDGENSDLAIDRLLE